MPVGSTEILLRFGAFSSVPAVLCSLAAFGFARLRWPRRNGMPAVLIATMLLPWQVTTVPRFFDVPRVALYGSLTMLLPKSFAAALPVYLIRCI